jgi:hypothetical protein
VISLSDLKELSTIFGALLNTTGKRGVEEKLCTGVELIASTPLSDLHTLWKSTLLGLAALLQAP